MYIILILSNEMWINWNIYYFFISLLFFVYINEHLQNIYFLLTVFACVVLSGSIWNVMELAAKLWKVLLNFEVKYFFFKPVLWCVQVGLKPSSCKPHTSQKSTKYQCLSLHNNLLYLCSIWRLKSKCSRDTTVSASNNMHFLFNGIDFVLIMPINTFSSSFKYRLLVFNYYYPVTSLREMSYKLSFCQFCDFITFLWKM